MAFGVTIYVILAFSDPWKPVSETQVWRHGSNLGTPKKIDGLQV